MATTKSQRRSVRERLSEEERKFLESGQPPRHEGGGLADEPSSSGGDVTDQILAQVRGETSTGFGTPSGSPGRPVAVPEASSSGEDKREKTTGIRLPIRLAKTLTLVSVQRRLEEVEPHHQKDIAADAIDEWLVRQGYVQLAR